MNIKRVLTTVIGLPLVILFFAFGNKYIMDIVFAIVGIIAMREYIKCVSGKVKVISWISYGLIAMIGVIHLIPANSYLKIFTYGIPTLLLLLFLHIIITDMKINFESIAYTLIGILYIFCFIVFLPLTYGFNGKIIGKILIGYIFISAWGTDIMAFLVGNTLKLGKTKFSKVSPKKSVEGCIAGLFGALILDLLFTVIINYFFKLNISYVNIGIIGIVLSIIGQIGDFAASTIKRYFEVKDFSELIPGHGGMIDRIDSVMFIAPFAYLLLTNFI